MHRLSKIVSATTLSLAVIGSPAFAQDKTDVAKTGKPTAQTPGRSDVVTILDPNKADYAPVEGTPFGNLSLRGDISKESGTFLSRTAPGGVAPWHWHTPIEEFVVVSGSVVIQVKGNKPLALKPGAYSQVPAGRPHRFRCASKEACVLFVVGSGAYDMHWVDEHGNELTAEQAMARPSEVGTKW